MMSSEEMRARIETARSVHRGFACCTDHDVGEEIMIGTDRFKLSGKLGEVLVGGTWSPIHIGSVLVALLLFIGDAEGGEAERSPIAVVIVEETDARIP